MPNSTPPSTPGRTAWFALTVAVVLAVAAVWQFVHLRTAHVELVALTQSTGLADARPELAAEVLRRGDPVDARIEAAVALVEMELDPSWVLDLSENDREAALAAGPERLEIARQIAADATILRPTSARAWLALGGATYLYLARKGDSSLNTEPQLWKEPLERARRQSPDDPGAARLLVAAQLDRWSLQDADERRATITLVTESFQDPRTFDLFYERWLRVAPTLADALAAIPDRSRAWRTLQDHFSRLEDWERHCLARDRWHAALDREIPETFQQGMRWMAGGELVKGRQLLLDSAASRRPGAADIATLEGVLAALPPGPIRRAEARALQDWLHWGLESCVFEECLLSERALSRLGRLLEDLDPQTVATLAEATGDPRRSAAIAARHNVASDPDWRMYQFLKARHAGADPRRMLMESGLQGVWQRTNSRRFSALFAGPLDNEPLVAQARISNRTPAVIETYLNGERLGCGPVVTGMTLRLPSPIAPGQHRVEVDVLHGNVGLDPIVLEPAVH